MTRDELLAILLDDYDDDPEASHDAHDRALLAYINDPAVTAAFWDQTKWYS